MSTMGPNVIAAVIMGLLVCLFIGFTMKEKVAGAGANLSDILDAVWSSNPQPLLMTLNATNKGDAKNLVVLVGTESSLRNVWRAVTRIPPKSQIVTSSIVNADGCVLVLESTVAK